LLHIPKFLAAMITAVAVFGILALYRFGYRAVERVILGLVATIGLNVLLVLRLTGPPGVANGHPGPDQGAILAATPPSTVRAG
jgi:Mn2+/Fe2+ NRAMP family transporter